MADFNRNHTLTLGPLLRTLTPGLLPHLRWTNILTGGEKIGDKAHAGQRIRRKKKVRPPFSGRHCNHQRHVLSDRLPRAPSPLAVLMCLHAGGNPMSASQRVSCRFHRLAVLSAAIPLLLGIIFSLWSSYQTANNELDRHHKLEC